MGDMAAGCQVKAGVLTPEEKLTENARRQFIKEVIEEIRFGTPNLPLLCGDKLPGYGIGAAPDDLYDREKYPTFHENYVDLYEKIAAFLNVKGSIMFPPVFDITISLPNIDLPKYDLSFDIYFKPDFAIKFEIALKKILLDIPDLKFPPDLPIPPALPTIPFKLPDLSDVKLDLNLKIKALFELPSILIPPDINLLLKIPNLPDFFLELCKKVKEKVVIQSPQAQGTNANVYEIAAIEVLARKTTQCCGITLVALTFGAGPLLCGGLGTKMNVAPPIEEEPPPPKPPAGVRESIVNAGKSGIGFNSANKSDIENYITYLFPYDVSETNPRGKESGYQFGYSLVKGKTQEGIVVPSAKYFSACGVTALAVYIHSGMKHPLIDKPFEDVVKTEIQTSKGKTNLNAFVVINKIALERNAIKYKSAGPEYKNLENLATTLSPGDIIVLGGDLQFDAQGKEIGTSNYEEWITDKKVLKGHIQVVESVKGLVPYGNTNKKTLNFTVIEATNVPKEGDLGQGQCIKSSEMVLGYPGANWGGKIVSLSPGRVNVVVDYIIDAEKFHGG